MEGQTNNQILDILVVLSATTITILIIMNLLAISLSYYLLRYEIEEVKDKNLRGNLLHCLNEINIVFFKKFILFKETDFFSDRKEYNNLLRYRMNNSDYKIKKNKFITEELTEKL